MAALAAMRPKRATQAWRMRSATFTLSPIPVFAPLLIGHCPSHRRPPRPNQFADSEGNDTPDEAEENPDGEVDLLLEFFHAAAHPCRPPEEDRAQEQNERHCGGDKGDELEQHDPSSFPRA